MEMVGCVRFSAVAIDRLMTLIHPVCEPRYARPEDRFFVDTVHPEIKLGEVEETPETQALGHLIDQALVIADLRSK